MGLDYREKTRFSLRNLWIGVAKRLGVRKSGLLKLRRDVRRCEYDDVHAMWEMLKRTEIEEACQSPKKLKKRSFWNYFYWARCAPYIYR